MVHGYFLYICLSVIHENQRTVSYLQVYNFWSGLGGVQVDLRKGKKEPENGGTWGSLDLCSQKLLRVSAS